MNGVKMKAGDASVSADVCPQLPEGSEGGWKPWLGKAWNAAIDLVFPPRCVACGGECETPAPVPLFCPTCLKNLALSEPWACGRCASRCSEVDVARGECSRCRGQKLLFGAARAIGPYEGALRRAVLQAKHAFHEPLAKALGQVLAERLRQMPFTEALDAVAAVPMHWFKRMWRNTNPEETIAGAVARKLGLENLAGALVCVRYLQRQSILNPADRRKNVRGAFRASRISKIAGKRILLVDDVMTTGATAHECSRALLDAGATAVFVATVARASPEF